MGDNHPSISSIDSCGCAKKTTVVFFRHCSRRFYGHRHSHRKRQVSDSSRTKILVYIRDGTRASPQVHLFHPLHTHTSPKNCQCTLHLSFDFSIDLLHLTSLDQWRLRASDSRLRSASSSTSSSVRPSLFYSTRIPRGSDHRSHRHLLLEQGDFPS